MKLSLVELREAAELYFRRHLEGEKWLALTEERRQRALLAAEADVALALDAVAVNAADELEMSALFEQALFLGCRPPEKEEFASGPRLVSEEVSGVGRRSWEYPDAEKEPEYAPRALRILQALRRRRFRIGRG